MCSGWGAGSALKRQRSSTLLLTVAVAGSAANRPTNEGDPHAGRGCRARSAGRARARTCAAGRRGPRPGRVRSQNRAPRCTRRPRRRIRQRTKEQRGDAGRGGTDGRRRGRASDASRSTTGCPGHRRGDGRASVAPPRSSETPSRCVPRPEPTARPTSGHAVSPRMEAGAYMGSESLSEQRWDCAPRIVPIWRSDCIS